MTAASSSELCTLERATATATFLFSFPINLLTPPVLCLFVLLADRPIGQSAKRNRSTFIIKIQSLTDTSSFEVDVAAPPTKIPYLVSCFLSACNLLPFCTEKRNTGKRNFLQFLNITEHQTSQYLFSSTPYYQHRINSRRPHFEI